MPDPDQPTESPQTYLSATSEIDTILAEIESASELDIDALAGRVERAAELISFCNARLKSAETRVRKVAQDLSANVAADLVAGESVAGESVAGESAAGDHDVAPDSDTDDDVPF